MVASTVAVEMYLIMPSFFAGQLTVSAENMPQSLRIQLPSVDSQSNIHSLEKDAKTPARSKVQISLCAESVYSMQASHLYSGQHLSIKEHVLSWFWLATMKRNYLAPQ